MQASACEFYYSSLSDLELFIESGNNYFLLGAVAAETSVSVSRFRMTHHIDIQPHLYFYIQIHDLVKSNLFLSKMLQ